MVDNTTEFEQEDFLQRIAKGWDVSQARTWMTEKRRERRKSSGLHTLAASATSLVGTNSDTLPPTFTLDYIRLRILQDQYKDLIYQTACRWTFEEILDLLHWEKSIPQRSYDHLFARISAIISDDEIRCEPSRRTEVVALELVREAYTLCDIQRVPDPDDLEFATSNLVHASYPTTTVCMDLSRFLDEDLHDMVEEEVEAIKTLTPMSISNRYQPECSLQAPSRAMTQQTELLRVAQQICHISVLHWRVWGPILYDLPDEPCDD